MHYAPLTYPSGWPRPASKLELFLMWIPIIGWIFAGLLENERLHPGEKHVQQMFSLRECIPPEIWGDEQKAQIADRIAKICQHCIGWQNRNFIPEDPFEIIIAWRTGDLCEVGALMNLEKEFRCKLDNAQVQHLMGMTFGEVVIFFDNQIHSKKALHPIHPPSHPLSSLKDSDTLSITW